MSNLVVPGEVAAAVTTRRIQFLSMLRTRIKAGDRPSDIEILNLIDLVEEGILRAQADDRRLNDLAKHFAGARGQIKGLMGHLEELRAMAEGLEPSTDIEDEEF